MSLVLLIDDCLKKRDVNPKFYIDYRPFNQRMKPDKFPNPLVVEIIEHLGGACVFSNLDMCAEY